MTTENDRTQQAAENRARLLWNDTPGDPAEDTMLDLTWESLEAHERLALTRYTTAVWEAAQLDLGQRALPMEVTHSGRGAWGTAVTLVSTDDTALAGAEKGTILAVLR